MTEGPSFRTNRTFGQVGFPQVPPKESHFVASLVQLIQWAADIAQVY